MEPNSVKNIGRRVALLYDERMCKHWDPEDKYHPESPERIRAIWKKLESAGIPERCVVFTAKEAKDKYLELVHTKKHIGLMRNISSKSFDSRRSKIASRFNSIYFNEGSSEAAYLAAGSVIEVSEKVAKGEYNSAVAIVRPPGYHAEPDEAMGFCLFNNVAVAASFLLNERPELGLNKILIVDWDVHHGNGTQKMFWRDPRVLFFSVHRHDFGSFYPGGDEGSLNMVGEGLGAGYNINVPWEHGQCGDADYLAVWDHILIPVAKAYNPDIVLISGGFDAAIGDPLGGCCITPYGYSIMMKKLTEFAGGKIILALEGGYNLNSISNSVLACVEALLEDKPIIGSPEAYPFASSWRVIQAVRQELSPFWPIFTEELQEKELLSRTYTFEPLLISNSESDDEKVEATIIAATEDLSESSEANISEVHDIVQVLSLLKVDDSNMDKEVALTKDCLSECLEQTSETSDSWRSDYAKIDIWYGSYGSNMWKPRFLCYIEGGQVEDMQKTCPGSKDKSLPKETMWKIVPHRLFFGHSHSRTWGSGGVAFLHPEINIDEKAYLCMYKITLEQFNDVLLQENRLTPSVASPLFDLSALDLVVKNRSMKLEALLDGWYSNVVYLGTEQEIPILTMTCSLADIEKFKSGVPMLPPSEGYEKTLVKGLVEGKQLTQGEAEDYLHTAARRGL
ncbi:histone deacetylase 5 [Aristolochia californica]|uniref:histone deacetylase 5 n=1 Tax=Aristolochia californica TaxID=171875 RepID=UPI0035D6DEB1